MALITIYKKKKTSKLIYNFIYEMIAVYSNYESLNYFVIFYELIAYSKIMHSIVYIFYELIAYSKIMHSIAYSKIMHNISLLSKYFRFCMFLNTCLQASEPQTTNINATTKNFFYLNTTRLNYYLIFLSKLKIYFEIEI